MDKRSSPSFPRGDVIRSFFPRPAGHGFLKHTTLLSPRKEKCFPPHPYRNFSFPAHDDASSPSGLWKQPSPFT